MSGFVGDYNLVELIVFDRFWTILCNLYSCIWSAFGTNEQFCTIYQFHPKGELFRILRKIISRIQLDSRRHNHVVIFYFRLRHQ